MSILSPSTAGYGSVPSAEPSKDTEIGSLSNSPPPAAAAVQVNQKEIVDGKEPVKSDNIFSFSVAKFSELKSYVLEGETHLKTAGLVSYYQINSIYFGKSKKTKNTFINQIGCWGLYRNMRFCFLYGSFVPVLSLQCML